MGLKYEHYIYNDDFDSKTEFVNEIYRFIDQIEKKEEKLRRLLDEDLYYWKNDETKKDYQKLIEEALEHTKTAKNKLRDIKEGIK